MLSMSKKDMLNCGSVMHTNMGQISNSHIMRTVHIAAIKEPANRSSLDLETGRGGPWDGQVNHHGQQTKIHA